MDQCKCSLHESFCSKLDSLRISYDAMFWSKVLCRSENYNSECRKGECHECMNGKKILFQNILDNEDMTNKEKAKMIISKS